MNARQRRKRRRAVTRVVAACDPFWRRQERPVVVSDMEWARIAKALSDACGADNVRRHVVRAVASGELVIEAK